MRDEQHDRAPHGQQDAEPCLEQVGLDERQQQDTDRDAGEAVKRAGRGFNTAALMRVMSGMTDYDVGGFRINLRPGLRDSVRNIDLISISADGRVLR